MPETDPGERLSSRDLDAVIRRASELQEQTTRTVGRADAVRIARELGLDPRHVEQAIEEVLRSRAPTDLYRLAAWLVVILGFVLVLLAIGRNLLS